ncbi:hypothetical protein Acr_00g0090080 [Actinidia rufa]|uniref:Reverse transcriptase/retrotransposon-derived protein RNase H-like domain-containing protein n=1 Tax=Actinidia rufa TaxID=165716 RepID=A0A7J0DWT4_9ERIC|nr:hypothetical protein Acr_00g0090080 [Actinidia rufa]
MHKPSLSITLLTQLLVESTSYSELYYSTGLLLGSISSARLARDKVLAPLPGSEEPKEVCCAVCETKEHNTISCPVILGIKEALHGQVNAIGHYGQGARNPYSNTYNPGWRDHPNFGWRNEGTSNPQTYQGGSLEDTLQQFIQSQVGVNSRVDKTLDDIKSQLTLLTQALTLAEKGKLPAQPQPNPSRHVHSTEISNQPSSSHEQVQAITVLRSGKTIDKTILPINPKGRGEASKVVEGTVGGDRETGEKKESEVVSREEEKKKRLVKRRLNVRENAFLAKDVHFVVQVKTPPKYKDLGCPIVTCVIGDHRIEGCLLDLGSNVNLLPYSVCLDYLEVEKVENFVNEDNGLEERNLLEVLKKHRKAIGWTLADLHGISPLVCTHRIYFEERAKPVRQMQRRLNPTMKEVVRGEVQKLLDAVYGNTYDQCLENLRLVLKRCEESNLVLNWEKCHFMVTQGIVLGHIISGKGIEVDPAKVELIQKLHAPWNVRDVRSFLGHAGFYRRFIQSFSAISRPLCALLAKDAPFEWNSLCQLAFDKLKNHLTTAPIIQPPDWSLPFKLMCDASDFAVGAVLGQRNEKKPHVLHYTSKILNEAQVNYTTTEKELLAIVFALDKF